MSVERSAVDTRVLLLAPTPRDGDATHSVLASIGITCAICASLDHLCVEVLKGAAAVIVPEEAVLNVELEKLARCFHDQAVWSDLPVIVMSRSGLESTTIEATVALLGNVSLIERPMRVSTLLSVVKSALRARERQYQVRDHLAEKFRTEERLKRDAMLLSNVRDSVIVTDLDGTVTFWNEGATRLFGFDASEMIGRHYAERLSEPSRSEVASWIQRIASGNDEFSGEWLDQRKDGSQVWIQAVTRRISDSAGNPVAIMGVSRDISQRKEAESQIEMGRAEIERSLSQWQAVVESMTEGLVLADAAKNIIMMNPAALEMHGFADSQDMITALSDYPNLFELHELSGGLLPLDEWPLSRVLRGEQFTNYEVQVVRRDMHTKWIGSYGGTSVRNSAGVVILAVLTVRDISEQKRAEALLSDNELKFRHLAETIPQLAWMARADGWIFWYNRRWYEYTGTTPAQMEGWGWQSVHDPGELPGVMERWQRSILTGDPFEMEFPLKGADGEFRWFLTRAAPLRDKDGIISFWFGTNTDIEDRRRIAQERSRLLDAERVARMQAEHVSQMKDEFLATLSHELRTPLNAILGWAHILVTGTKNAEDTRKGLLTIERNARAQARIIEDLLDMSRIISGKVRLDVQRVDFASVVQNAVETTRPAADAKEIRLQAVLDPNAGPISGDPNRLQQVLWNLLTNAVKFTPKKGRIQVTLERVNSHIEVSVIDTGEGIKPEFLPLVFDRFRQADASTTRSHGGLGLGLAIVKQLVELHGGSVRVTSPGVGKGTTFTVSLPLITIHPELKSDEIRRHPAAAGGKAVSTDLCASLAATKILVVDDEPDSRNLICRLLEDCDAIVATAASASEALDHIRRDPPHVLVSDIGMPVEDGYALIRKVRRLDPQHGGSVPALALTAYARSEDRLESIRAGFQLHLSKPVEPAELIMMVASLIKRVGQ